MRSVALTLTLLVVLFGSLPVAVGGVTQSSTGATQAVPSLDGPAVQPQVEADTGTRITIDLHENASASWNVTFVYALDSANETAAFERYATDFEAQETDGGLDPAIFESLASSAATQTGRPMAIENVSRSAAVADDQGRLTLTFTWTNFLQRTSPTTLQFNDAVLVAGNETWLATLGPSQTLVIRPPPGHSVTSTELPSFDLRENAVVIEGPQRFNGDISITYEQTAGPVGQQLPWEYVVPAIVAAAVLLGGAILLSRRGGTTPGEPDAAADSASTETEGGDEAGPDQPPADESTAAATDDVTSASDAATDDAEPADEVDLSLLSDEERVEYLLELAGGRMKQASIVKETGWSDAKVSQLLSAMAEEGRVEKLRLGRENLISLPDEDPNGDAE